jgi:hypothetical protein
VALAANAVRASPSVALHEAVCDALAQIIDLLERVDTLLSKYDRAFETPRNEASRNSVPEGLESVVTALRLEGQQNDISKATENFKQLKESLQSKTSFPRRIKYGIQTWNEADQEILKNLISAFKYWNDALIEITPFQNREIMELEVKSQIVGPAESLDQLENIESAAKKGNYESIRRSARVKIQRLSSQKEPKEIINLEKKYSDLQMNPNVAKSRRFLTEYSETGEFHVISWSLLFLRSILGIERSSGSHQPQPVIVEWFYYDAKWVEGDLTLANERVERLAQDLSAREKPQHLPVLTCIGWVQHPEKKDRALLYSMPNNSLTASTSSPPVSLLEVLTKTPTTGSILKSPTLGDRFRLASTLAIGFLELHTVGWLHKNFNSQNVLLLRNNDGAICYSKPFIVGFDFARPDKPGEISLSMRPSQLDLYRHPEVRASRRPVDDSKSLFRKPHDVYSLGMVLFEIGMWSRLDGYSKPNLTSDAFRKRIRGYIERDLPIWMGDQFSRAVDACLSGEYIKTLDAISLDAESAPPSSGIQEPQSSTTIAEEANAADLDNYCRRIVNELGRCHCDMGQSDDTSMQDLC